MIAVAVNIFHRHIVDIAGDVTTAVTVTGVKIHQTDGTRSGIPDVADLYIIYIGVVERKQDHGVIKTADIQIADGHIVNIPVAGIEIGFAQKLYARQIGIIVFAQWAVCHIFSRPGIESDGIIFGVTGDIFDQKLRTARAQVDAVAVFAAAVKIQVVQMGFFRHSEAEGPAAGLNDLQIADFNIFHPGKVKEMGAPAEEIAHTFLFFFEKWVIDADIFVTSGNHRLAFADDSDIFQRLHIQPIAVGIKGIDRKVIAAKNIVKSVIRLLDHTVVNNHRGIRRQPHRFVEQKISARKNDRAGLGVARGVECRPDTLAVSHTRLVKISYFNFHSSASCHSGGQA